MTKLHTGHEFEMECLEKIDQKVIESALYSIECAQKEIEKMKHDAGITEQRFGHLYDDEYRAQKIARRQSHIAKLKKHYGI